MKISRQFLRAILWLAFSLLAGGCSTATNALWQRQTYHPAEHPLIKLALDERRHDILVRYDEQMNKDTVVKERAYWLFASANSGTPVFVADSDLASLNHLVDVPVFQSKKDLQHPSVPGFAAFAKPNGRDFELWQDGKATEVYELPSYSNHARANPLRILLTPGAVTTDALITAGKKSGPVMEDVGIFTVVFAYYAAPYVLEAYANCHH